jgi:hypothetical protein
MHSNAIANAAVSVFIFDLVTHCRMEAAKELRLTVPASLMALVNPAIE